MGAWGAAIFSDDLAADVRDDFRELIGEGLNAAQATRRLCRQYKDVIADREVSLVFWLALAATQWKLGRLEENVKKKAIKIIESGKELNHWDDVRLRSKRAVVLEKLREQLLAPPPPPRQIRQRIKYRTEWELGEMVAFRLLSERFVVFRVIGFHEDKGSRFSVCELIDWIGKTLPEMKEIATKPIRREAAARGYSQFLLDPVKKVAHRLVRLGFITRPAQKPDGYVVIPWQYIDRLIEEVFGYA
jgi:hypothetical protein